MQTIVFLFVLLAVFSNAGAFMFKPAFAARSHMSLEMKSTGRVKFFDSMKGFGFITPDDGSGDVFVHQSSVFAQGFRSLAEGEPVEYDVQEDKAKGKIFASNVTGPKGAYVQGAKRQDHNY